MTLISRAARILSFVMTCSLGCVALHSVVSAQDAPQNTPGKNSAPTLIQQMVGTWNVQQRMWPGSGAGAINLPPAIARRRLVEGAFLEEIMEPPQRSGPESFTRRCGVGTDGSAHW